MDVFKDLLITYGAPVLIGGGASILLMLLNKVATAAINFFEAKTGIEVGEATEAKIDAIIASGVNSAEEYARRKFKMEKATIPSQDKFHDALGMIKNRLDKAGIEIPAGELEQRIHEMVNLKRGSTGSLGE